VLSLAAQAGQSQEPAPCSLAAKSLPSFVGAARSGGGQFRVDVFAETSPLPVNRLVTLLVILRGNGASGNLYELSEVSADMLAHRHGMYTQHRCCGRAA
jgi:hypothetical protein